VCACVCVCVCVCVSCASYVSECGIAPLLPPPSLVSSFIPAVPRLPNSPTRRSLVSRDEAHRKVHKTHGAEDPKRAQDHAAAGGVVQLLEPGEGGFAGGGEAGTFSFRGVVEVHGLGTGFGGYREGLVRVSFFLFSFLCLPLDVCN